MSNLEDVFLKINKEYAPDLFGDLSKFDASQNSSTMSDKENLAKSNGKIANSIAHSTENTASRITPDDKVGTFMI